jgi:hypothetical protein
MVNGSRASCEGSFENFCCQDVDTPLHIKHLPYLLLVWMVLKAAGSIRDEIVEHFMLLRLWFLVYLFFYPKT